MLFNSYTFVLLYLPITALIFFRLGSHSRVLAASWLAAASLFFYGYWNPAYVGLLLLSILFNYGIAFALVREPGQRNSQQKNLILTIGIGADLALLGYYKYANFFLDTANHLFATDWPLQNILLPLGISFFTFTQIAFLVDVWSGKAREYSFVHYVLFVTYFPHLIAGPVLHHKEMMPQFAQPETYKPSWENISIGLTIFSIGLFKKAVLADGIAPYANDAFAAANTAQGMDFLTAWGGALSYTTQLYFDFSGYSDMAIGVSRLFGIVLPLNFNSPYKAASISDFWRRWHMTLSRFLRDYLYISLGGSRKGPLRRQANLMVTMLLGGLWHGASWNFVLWGGLHGIYLVINHAWRAVRGRISGVSAAPGGFERLAGWGLTFVAVVIAWVFFRAPTLAGALNMLRGMLGMHGFSLPAALAPTLGGVADSMRAWGVEFQLGGGSRFVLTWAWTLALLAVALFLPNTQQLMRLHRPGLDFDPTDSQGVLEWKPNGLWAWALAVIAAAGVLSLSQATEFLYYQF
ncbi:Peptidoglycan O-acetyltransferase [Candidatus Accumulibacter aalborgensis]|uniref:Probable alginate O-acetylase AlgI n=1 Tax=Candidatus Accumulibacter aalborgensis TaxID=1860102 RepID=A0A1A8XDX6_9PROT|nr:MBOAT family protein [Candidatus Accumulibacter aalborgensis]SBT03404.1 Peptidoglycan O-acetyltransferase [Candidatus Accumulibacter aalborgensis]